MPGSPRTGVTISVMSRPLSDSLRQALSVFPEIRLAVLFGSIARGRSTARSDVDVGLLLDEHPTVTLWEIEGALGEAVHRTVDLVDLHRAPPLLRFEIARHGRPLLERQEGEWKRFQVRALLDWWDWAPTARRLHRLAAEGLRRELRHGPA